MEDWELKAREQIRHLAARDNAFGDSGRFENVMALFAEDAVVEVVGRRWCMNRQCGIGSSVPDRSSSAANREGLWRAERSHSVQDVAGDYRLGLL